MRGVHVLTLALMAVMACFGAVPPAHGGALRHRTLRRRSSQSNQGETRPMTVLEAESGAKEDVDEQLYSRQLLVYGKSSQKRLMGAHVLLYGANYESEDLLAEVAKNLALAGVGKISIRTEPPRGGVPSSRPRLVGECASLVKYCSEINPLIQVSSVYDIEEGFRDFSPYTVVVACNVDIATLGELNARIRASSTVALVAVKAQGVAGYIFNDFGDHFDVEDLTGEHGKNVPLRSAVEAGEAGVLDLACIEEETFGLGIGDHLDVVFEAGGFAEGALPASITGLQVISVDSPTSISVRADSDEGHAETIRDALTKGRPVVVKKAVETLELRHVPLVEALRAPSFTQCNGCLSAKQDRAWSLCLLSAFMSLEEPSLTGTDFTERSFRTALLANLISLGVTEPLKPVRGGGVGRRYLDMVTQGPMLYHHSLSTSGSGRTCPATVSVLGSMASQEAIKAITHVHSPISQFFVFESFSSLLREDYHRTGAGEQGPPQTPSKRPDAVYGAEVAEELARLKVFVVGSGAIGCELLKTLSLMGVATGDTGPCGDASGSGGSTSRHGSSLWSNLQGGGVVLTDMDSIERSNLNRQLLFRQRHVGQPKALVAAEMAKTLHKDLKIHALTSKVAPDTEDVFGAGFWRECDVVITALDNVDARRFVDEKCVQYQKILLDSGTLGTKGNTQVVLPFLSESYGSSADPPEEAVPLCTLKSFPYMSDHCVSWARALFTQCFSEDIEALRSSVVASRKPVGALETFLGNLAADDAMRLGNLARLLEAHRTHDTSQQQQVVIQWALRLFHKVFFSDVAQLLAENPLDKLDDEGQPFWGGSRRQPKPQAFDATDPKHRLFLAQCVRLVCRVCGLAKLSPIAVPDENDPLVAQILPLAQAELEGSTATAIPDASVNDVTHVAQTIRLLDPGVLERLNGEEFEKDDLSLGHVAFASAASNIRCAIYSLPSVDSLHVQKVAGNIVPAVATTTALVAGLVSLELVKVASERVNFRRKVRKRVRDEEQEQEDEPSGFSDLNRLYSSSKTREAEKERLLERFRNTFANLARPLLAFAQPVEAEGYPAPAGSELFTMWSILEVPTVSSGAVTVQGLEAFLRKRLNQPSLELQSISLGDSLVYANFLPLHDDEDGEWEHFEEPIHVEHKAVQSLVLRMLAKGDGFGGEGERETDFTDETAFDPAAEQEHLMRAHTDLSVCLFLDLDVVCVNGEDGEDYRLPRVRLPLDAVALAAEQSFLEERLNRRAALLEGETQELEQSPQLEGEEYSPVEHNDEHSSGDSSGAENTAWLDAPDPAHNTRGVRGAVEHLAGRAMKGVGQWARKALRIEDSPEQEQRDSMEVEEAAEAREETDLRERMHTL